MEKHPIFVYSRWVCALKPEVETLDKERILVIVKNTQSELYLIVQYTSNNEISFVSWKIENGDTKEWTVSKELFEETWIDRLTSLEEKPERFFEVHFYSPHRNKNFLNKTHVYIAETEQVGNQVESNEQKIQNPHWRTLQQIKAKLEAGKLNTNYESMEYLVSKLEQE